MHIHNGPGERRCVACPNPVVTQDGSSNLIAACPLLRLIAPLPSTLGYLYDTSMGVVAHAPRRAYLVRTRTPLNHANCRVGISLDHVVFFFSEAMARILKSSRELL
jgi:hypothetical protein